jgi:hypothetical protein
MSAGSGEGLGTAIVAMATDAPDAAFRSEVEEAFRLSRPELAAIPSDKLLVINCDIPSAVCKGLGTAERVVSWRPRIVAELPSFDIKYVDCLAQYAKALMYAEVGYAVMRKGPADIRGLAERALHLYRVLLADAQALAERGLIRQDCLARLRRTKSHADKAFALSGLVHVLRSAWPEIEDKTAVTLAELDAAERQGMELMFGLAYQKKPLGNLAEVSEARQRAFTLFVGAYQQVRRAMEYLGWGTSEAERVVPSLYARRRRPSLGKSKAVLQELADVAASDQSTLLATTAGSEGVTVPDLPKAAPAVAAPAITATPAVGAGVSASSETSDKRGRAPRRQERRSRTRVRG